MFPRGVAHLPHEFHRPGMACPMHGRALLWMTWGPALLLLAGCNDPPPPDEPPHAASPDAASQFDPATAGAVSGQVSWGGELPDVPPYRSRPSPMSDHLGHTPRNWDNPN